MIAAAPEPKANMGKPEPRYDGRLKVTGAARYSSDMPLKNPVFAFLVTSSIAKGRIEKLDLALARAVPGVLDILTQDNTSELKGGKFGQNQSTSIDKLGPEIAHDGQIIAMVLADSYEAAREAAYKVKATYVVEPASTSFGSAGLKVEDATKVSERHKKVPNKGDAEAALASADVVVDAEYATPTQHHNPLELFTTTCVWQGNRLTVYEPSQFVHGLKNGAAKKLNRPVKLVPTRDQGFTIVTYRAETRHHVRLGARRDGKIVGYSHEGWEVTSRPDAYVVAGVEDSARMYDFGAVHTKVNAVRADRNTPGFMRSPPVVPYIYALESAMDELAAKLAIDPVELRRINDTMHDPITGKPYSSRSLMRCYDEAAKAFDWSRRNPEPRSMRDGDWFIGLGCATAVYPTHVGPAAARVRMLANGEVQVQIAAHEIGNGAYTVIGQMAAERLGVPLSSVKVELGDSSLPPAPVAGGSNTTASTCNAVRKACDAIRVRLTRSVATADRGRAAGFAADNGQEMRADLFRRLGVGAIE